VTRGGAEPLRIALLYHDYGAPNRTVVDRYVYELAIALLDTGHGIEVLSTHRGGRKRTVEDRVPVVHLRRLPEAPLRQRGFAGPLTHVAPGIGALVAGGFNVVHAFSTADALMALIWQRLVGRPTAFTCVEKLRRDRLADRRLRLRLLQGAVEDTGAVIAATERSRESLWRWLAVDAPVMGSDDVDGHERLYRGLVAQRAEARRAG